MHLSEYLKSKRQSVGITQEQLANTINVSKQAVSKWENGLALPDIMIIPKLAQALRVRPKHIIDIIWGEQSEINTFVFTCDGVPSFRDEAVAVSSLPENRYQVRCTESTYDHILEKYGKELRLKTVRPQKKVLSILRTKAPTHLNYSSEEKFNILRDECCSRLCGVIYFASASQHSSANRRRVSILRDTIAVAYRNVLDYESFTGLCKNAFNQWDFDCSYRALCDELIEKEREILSNPLFGDAIDFRQDVIYLSPHFVIQSIFADLISCGIIEKSHRALPFLHYTISTDRAQFGFERWDMSNFDEYLRYQTGMARLAESEGMTRIELSLAEEEKRLSKGRKNSGRGGTT